jgi:ribosomal protein S18 acetylase RimI-like enzyme
VTTIPDSAVAPSADPIEIAERPPGNPDAARLLRAFHGEQLHRYGFADPAELTSGEYMAPSGVFAVVYYSAIPAGCGGYRWFDQTTRTVEIKRIYIAPASRGLGAGRALLAWLERHAVAAGARRAILETGVRNTAALGLFTSAGYRPVDRYVEGRDPAINRAFARLLTSEG